MKLGAVTEVLLAEQFNFSEEEKQSYVLEGDNGIDGVIDQDPLGVDQVYIQAKPYAQGNNIGAGDIRDFLGALNLKKAYKGIFITTSDFTISSANRQRFEYSYRTDKR